MSTVESERAPTIRWARGEEDLAGAIAIRELVFCREQGVTLEEEHDGFDAAALHVVARDPDGHEVIGTLRLLGDGETAKIGRVAVRRDWRRRGVALRMLELAIDRAVERGFTRARLAAQLDAIELYRRVGFEVESEPFDSARIVHVWMGRTL